SGRCWRGCHTVRQTGALRLAQVSLLMTRCVRRCKVAVGKPCTVIIFLLVITAIPERDWISGPAILSWLVFRSNRCRIMQLHGFEHVAFRVSTTPFTSALLSRLMANGMFLPHRMPNVMG